jgi:hypothetical protein
MPTNSPKRPRGRPAHKPTPAMRRQVSVAAGGGMRHQDIAIALGIDRDTLAKHYQAELTVVATMRRMEVLQALHIAAKKGSSSAAKAYLANEPHFSVPPEGVGDAAAAQPPEAPKTTPKEVPLGKKAQADADAVTAARGTGWDDLLSTRAPLQ